MSATIVDDDSVGRVRILYLDHGTKPVGGGQTNTLSLIRSLDRRRFRPILVSSAENAFTQSAREEGVDVHIHPLPQTLTRLGRSSVRYDPYHLAVSGAALARAVAGLARLTRELRADVLHPCDNLMRVMTAIIGPLTGTPVVCPIMEDFRPSFTSNMLRRLYLSTMDYLLPVSERAAEFFRKGRQSRARIVVTYTGIDVAQFSEEVAAAGRAARQSRYPGELVIGVIGRLVAIKGQADLIRAMPLLRAADVRAHCLIVGDGPDLTMLQALVEELGVSDMVVFMGFRRDVAEVMSRVDVIVVPSHDEASSRVVLEAGALGIAVVATRVGGIPEMLQDGVGGLLVNAGDPRALADAMMRLRDPETRRRMGTAARNRVHETFANEVITRRVEDIYASVSKRRIAEGRNG